MVLYSVEAVALRGPCRVCMIATEILNTFLESSDIVLSLVPDQNWFLKVDQISPTLLLGLHSNRSSFCRPTLHTSPAKKASKTDEKHVIFASLIFFPIPYFWNLRVRGKKIGWDSWMNQSCFISWERKSRLLNFIPF